MSLIKNLQDFLGAYPGMELQPLPKVLTDQTGENPSSYALAPAGNGKIKTDIIGNKTFQNSYLFYAKESAANEIDRQDNYDFLEGLTDWLEEQNDAGNYPALPCGYAAESLEVSNGMMVDLFDDGTGLYQIQIQFTFERRKNL